MFKYFEIHFVLVYFRCYYFGFTANAGIVQYAVTFLITDIISEKYGKKEAGKAVWYSISACAAKIKANNYIFYLNNKTRQTLPG